jgi:hypothetical protein
MLRQVAIGAIPALVGISTVVRPAHAVLLDAPRSGPPRSVAVNPQPLPPGLRFQSVHQPGRRTPPDPCRACVRAR